MKEFSFLFFFFCPSLYFLLCLYLTNSSLRDSFPEKVERRSNFRSFELEFKPSSLFLTLSSLSQLHACLSLCLSPPSLSLSSSFFLFRFSCIEEKQYNKMAPRRRYSLNPCFLPLSKFQKDSLRFHQKHTERKGIAVKGFICGEKLSFKVEYSRVVIVRYNQAKIKY